MPKISEFVDQVESLSPSGMIDYKDIEAIAARTGIDPEDDRVILALVERGWTYAPASLWGERDDLLLKH